MVVPSYFSRFSCIAGACKHSCCIGWEIGIDEKTSARYREMPRLQNDIVWGNPPRFRMREHERCPFLNGDNLCDLILEFGEDVLCDICREHPRFYNDLPGRTEAGLGLCCEEAARLILTWNEKVTFDHEPETDDELLTLRDELFTIVQNRNLPLMARMETVIHRMETTLPTLDFYLLLKGLERLSPAWDSYLEKLRKPIDTKGFAEFMKPREYEYENLLFYFLYRYFALAFDFSDAASRARFAVFACLAIGRIGCAMWTENGTFSVEDQVELVRMFSSEVEYSEENLDRVLDELYA
ncbi:MAG: hypothetical protein E7471_05260 [Ruminococcaceae bacterium]|nr:hypothetical protein [Oscillospiraceae bacterium]